MVYRIIGDVHGRFGPYGRLLADSPHPTLQIGDMGVGFFRSNGNPLQNPPYDKMVAGDHQFIRGNHDNPDACRKHSQCIKDGTFWEKESIMFIGGEDSIDKAWRTPGFSWWEDEELSPSELEDLFEKYIQVKPKIMITHGCPVEMSQAIVALQGGKWLGVPSRTSIAFQRMWVAHKPKLWVFGHWHTAFDTITNGTRFICLPELEFIDIDPETV